MSETFIIQKELEKARIGIIQTAHGNISTPVLYPVVNFIGGTTPMSGGFWKYTRDYILQMNIPVLSQVMHFLDYRSVNRKSLERWRQKPLREWFGYQQPLFLDSGGYKLLMNEEFDLGNLGLDTSPETIFDLQRGFGADLIATLDYPLPNGIIEKEAKQRMERSIANAVATLKLLEKRDDNTTQIYVVLHGRNQDEIVWYIRKLIRAIHEQGVERPINGFAIGSLVPRRNSIPTIIDIVTAAKNEIKEQGFDKLPLHIFGIASELLPLLVYLGFDSFDTSTYAQMARNLAYIHPQDCKQHNIRKLSKLECNCIICKDISLRKIQAVLGSDVTHRKIKGMYKSECYAAVAVHNLILQLNTMAEIREALQADSLVDFILEFAEKHEKARVSLQYYTGLANTHLACAASRVHFTPIQKEIPQPSRIVSLNVSDNAFVLPVDYTPPRDKKMLLILPCSYEKPYTVSRSFKFVESHLKTNLNGNYDKVHIVFISGLFGPVPIEFVQQPPLTTYDYHLTTRNKSGIQRVSQRLRNYVLKHKSHYDSVFAYVTSKPYRIAVENLTKDAEIMILPPNTRRHSPHEFYKKESIYSLVDTISTNITDYE